MAARVRARRLVAQIRPEKSFHATRVRGKDGAGHVDRTAIGSGGISWTERLRPRKAYVSAAIDGDWAEVIFIQPAKPGRHVQRSTACGP